LGTLSANGSLVIVFLKSKDANVHRISLILYLDFCFVFGGGKKIQAKKYPSGDRGRSKNPGKGTLLIYMLPVSRVEEDEFAYHRSWYIDGTLSIWTIARAACIP
jgi:hypothetical protein